MPSVYPPRMAPRSPVLEDENPLRRTISTTWTCSSFGQLTEFQEKAILRYLRTPVILDLGCGDLSLAYRLVSLGARSVIGLDKNPSKVRPGMPQVIFVQTTFEYWALEVPVVFVSWPSNYYNEHLLRIIQNTPRVIYLGSNLEGSACGDPSLFKHLACRDVLVHVPDPRNSLIVYGHRARRPRRHMPEELAGIQQSTIWHYEELVGRDLPYASY